MPPLDPALLAAIVAEPDDDALRLVAADWFEEHGDDSRAEFVRLQCKLATPAFASGACACTKGYECEYHVLRQRERDLLLKHGHDWLHGVGIKTICHDGGIAEGVNFEIVTGIEKGSGIQVDFSRGFVDEARCPLEDWISHGPRLVRTEPLRTARLVGHHPWNSGNHRWGWSKAGHDRQFSDYWIVPEGIFDCLPPTDSGLPENRVRRWYKFAFRANNFLSQAALRWARKLAAQPV